MNRLYGAVPVLVVLLTSRLWGQQYGWTVVARPDSVYGLNAVCFVDSSHGWCASALRIYRTTDGGVTWKTGTQPYEPAFLYDLSFSDTQLGWAVAAIGGAMIWRTTDGGLSWIDQTGYLGNRRYLATVAVSAQKDITVGSTDYLYPDTGKIIQTTDGGTTWIERSVADSIAGFDDLFFLDSLHGWAPSGMINGGPAILRTQDGGTTWQVLPSQGQHQLFFLDTVRGWAARGSQIYRTSDGGVSWQYLTFIHDPDPLSHDDLGTSALSFSDALNGRAFGSIVYQGIITEGIYRTTDGGLSWFRESIGLTGDFGGVNDAQMLDAYHGWAVCNEGSVLRYQLLDSGGNPPALPLAYSLDQNYPNPFNSTTTIQYKITGRTYVTLQIYDLLGRRVQVLVDQMQETGNYDVRFDGSMLSSGVYYYRLNVGEYTQTKEMILMK
jgi:photosystem II stability/assembly factor-like uncharacterized protein